MNHTHFHVVHFFHSNKNFESWNKSHNLLHTVENIFHFTIHLQKSSKYTRTCHINSLISIFHSFNTLRREFIRLNIV